MTLATITRILETPPAWAVMWAIAFATFFACKWLTWHFGVGAGRSRPADAAAYFFAWPGMDPAQFLHRQSTRDADRSRGRCRLRP